MSISGWSVEETQPEHDSDPASHMWRDVISLNDEINSLLVLFEKECGKLIKHAIV